MKRKSTIRKMRGTPLTRAIAHYQREQAAQTRRLNKIIDQTGELEFRYITLRKWADAQEQENIKRLEAEHDCPWKRHMERLDRERLESEGAGQAGPEHTAPAERDPASVEAWR